jgi:hypothetical protein
MTHGENQLRVSRKFALFESSRAQPFGSSALEEAKI